MRIILLKSDDEMIMALCAGMIHKKPGELPDEKVKKANQELQKIFEDLGFEFCDCQKKEIEVSELFPKYL